LIFLTDAHYGFSLRSKPMRNTDSLRQVGGASLERLNIGAIRLPRNFLLGVILIFALLAFEAFNFDTTRYALENLMGDIRFAGIAWATILAVAFCAIDFAGLGRLMTPERGRDEPKEIWYLTGAWLLGATMNAVMTWWAVSNVLLSHDLGNEVLSREQLLHIVPVFVAILVWLTRILFIGAVTMAGERLLHGDSHTAQKLPTSYAPTSKSANVQNSAYTTQKKPSTQGRAAPMNAAAPVRESSSVASTTRVSRRPPRPSSRTGGQVPHSGMRTSGRQRR
jgi:hypothetical protein